MSGIIKSISLKSTLKKQKIEKKIFLDFVGLVIILDTKINPVIKNVKQDGFVSTGYQYIDRIGPCQVIINKVIRITRI